jgi:hypothetical protein
MSVMVTTSATTPIVAERAVWWPGSAWHEAHVSPGAVEAGTAWAVAEGEVGGPTNAKSYVLVGNTSDRFATIRATWIYEDDIDVEYFLMWPHSRLTIDTVGGTPAIARRFGMIVESVGTPDPALIVVERAMYSDANGVTWAAGSGSLATRLR